MVLSKGFSVVFLLFCLSFHSCGGEAEYISLQLGGITLDRLELALTPPSRTYGLMYRESLAANAGMLFVFPQEEIQSFWMKNTLIPLDLIYLNDRAEIIKIHTMAVEPPRGQNESMDAYERRLRNYSSGKPASIALELKAGLAAVLQIKAGDRLLLDVEALKVRCQ